MFTVYIIQSKKDNSLYIGSTGNYAKRIYEHNFGRTGYTKYKRPWKLLHFEKYQTKRKALKREKYLKRLKSKKYIETLIKSSCLMGR